VVVCGNQQALYRSAQRRAQRNVAAERLLEHDTVFDAHAPQLERRGAKAELAEWIRVVRVAEQERARGRDAAACAAVSARRNRCQAPAEPRAGGEALE
jgi:hypothetical protein